MTVLAIAAACAAAVAAFTPSPACADSWLPPETWSELSPCGEYRFTASPAPHDGYKPIDDARPSGVLERRNGDGEWEQVWLGSLVNEIVPTSALVSDDGEYVVTFDNWYSHGHGENVIVIYGPDGTLIRSMKLTDIIPEMYKDSLQHSTNSVSWRDGAGIVADGKSVFVDIHAPGTTFFDDTKKTHRFSIAFSDGAVTLPREREWRAALSKARFWALDAIIGNLEYQHMMRSPVTAPKSCEAYRWRTYLSEVYQRLSAAGSERGFVTRTVLLPPEAEDHRRTFVNFKSFLTNRRMSDNQMAVAAPCARQVLITAAEDVAKMAENEVDPDPYSNATLYVSAPRADFETVLSLLASSGIDLIWLDPELPIEQRADRLLDNEEFIAELETYQQQLEAEIEAAKD